MKMELKYKASLRILSLVAVGLLMFSTSCLMFVCDPLQLIIKKVLQLSEGSLFFNLWSNPPYDVFLKVYAFNITNPEEFLNGEKMNVSEIGPFTYKEILTNENATFHDDGSVTYTPHREFVFESKMSVSDPKDTYMTTTNIPLVGLQSFLTDGSFFSNLGFSTLARTLGAKPIINVSLHDYLWGYEDRLVKVANQFIPSWIDFGRFGILERLMSRDNTNTVRIAKEPSKLKSNNDLLSAEEQQSQYHILEWNGSPGLAEWGYKDPDFSDEKNKKCSLVEGAYDGTIFPRDLRQNRTLTLFRKAFCRPVPIEYVKEDYTDSGYISRTYKMADWMFDTPENAPQNECFCKKNCRKGLQNISPCYYGIPVVLSQPHFLNADPTILDEVNGMEPDPAKHGSTCEIQPDLGVPLGGHMRIQINLGVGQTKYNTQTRPFNGLTIPLFYLEITAGELPGIVTFLLTLLCKILPIVMEVLKYLLGVVGFGLVSGAAVVVLFTARPGVPGGVSLNTEYTPLPILKISEQLQQYYMVNERTNCLK